MSRFWPPNGSFGANPVVIDSESGIDYGRNQMDLRISKAGGSQMRRVVCATLIVLVVCAQSQAPQTIQLTIDYNDGVQKQFVLPFQAGMTVFDAMTAAKANPHGLTFDCDPKFPCNAGRANRMLASIDDVKNQGSGASARNWVFWVNGVASDQGFGVCKIGSTDKILWKFDIYHAEQPRKACR